MDDGFYLFDNETFKNNLKNDSFLQKEITQKLINSKERIQKNGEVFTPKWMVDKMLSVPDIQNKINDLHATFFEPSAGDGAFLREILNQKLNYVDNISNKSNWTENALWSLMSIYAIEYLSDNVFAAKNFMLLILVQHYQSFYQKKLGPNTDFYKSIKLVVDLNIVQGNTLTYVNSDGEPIMFNEWKIFSDGVKRVPFLYESLFTDEQLDLFNTSGQISLFSNNNDVNVEYKKVGVLKVYKEEKE